MDAHPRAVPHEKKRKSGEIRLGPLNIPVRLLQALREDRLVIFVGAGASRPHPSNLPDFEALTEQIAEGALERKANEPPDIFLGRLAELGIQVYNKAARILGAPTSQPNELHRLLVGLFPTPSSLRIVTTNFDRHFEGVIPERWPNEDIEIYSAPALPLGSRFSGLVYAHGQLGKDLQRLVLTDIDFGKAYLTEGWARRFLREVFASYDVLFVGYSHEDVVLRYLARGLPPTRDRMRFALTPSGSSERWRFLGITPLEYDPVDNHAALREGLKAWLDLEGRGPLSHEREIQELVQRSPQALTEQEEDYLLFCVQDPTLSQFFYRHAAASEWLAWANERSLISHIFNPISETAETSIVAYWLMQEALAERGDVAREIVSKESRLSSRLWNKIAQAVWRALDTNGGVDAKATERAAGWLSILERHDEASFDREIINYWLKHLSAQKHAFFAIQVLLYLLRPVVVFEKQLSHSDDGKWTHVLKPAVKVRADHHWLAEEWERLFKPNLHLFARHLAPVVLSYLHEAHLLLRSQGVASEAFDPLSYGRSATEPHEQNQHGINEAFDILIDAGRDILDWLLQNQPRVALHLMEAWLPIEAPLVRRLCIYGIAQYPQMSANTKISRVVTERWLEQWQLRHEIFFLLRGAYKDSGVSVRKRLLREAERAYIKQAEKVFDDPLKEEKSRAYELYNLLAWLQGADPSCPLVAERIKKLRLKYPDLEVQDHPDFSHWSYGVHTVHYVSPVSMEEILKLEPPEWVQEFEQANAQKDDPRQFIERGGLGFLAETEKAAGVDFNWGMKLAEYLAAEALWDHSGWHYLFRSWANNPVSTEIEWNRLISFVQEHSELLRHGTDIADVLLRRIENRDLPATEEMILEELVLAESLWPTLPSEEEEEDVQDDWVQAGVNRAGGKLGLFIVHSLSRLRGIYQEEWSGIPNSFRPILEGMANAGTDCSPFGRVMLCSQLHFMFAIDSPWTKENLFPLFDWSLSARIAVQAWNGFLIWGRPTRELLAEFMPRVEQTFNHLEELGRFSKRFSELLASIAYSSSENPLEKGWIKTFLRKAQPTDRTEWARTISSILNDISKEERRRLWDTWLRSYVEFRLDSGIPFEDDEWRAMIKWSILLEDFLPEVVELLTRRPVAKTRDSLLYFQIRKQEGLFKYPDSLADFLLYLLGAEEDLFHHCDYLAEIFRRLLGVGASKVKLRQIAERLAELGCTNAQELAGLI